MRHSQHCFLSTSSALHQRSSVTDSVRVFQDGGTPFFVACQCNHIEVAELLLQHHANIHVKVGDTAQAQAAALCFEQNPYVLGT